MLDRAFSELTFEIDPLAATFPQLAKDAVTAGAAETEPNLAGLVDVTALNAVLRGVGQAGRGRRRTGQGSGVTQE